MPEPATDLPDLRPLVDACAAWFAALGKAFGPALNELARILETPQPTIARRRAIRQAYVRPLRSRARRHT